MSLAIRNVKGLFSRIFGLKSSIDPIRETIAEATAQIDRILLNIEGTINNLNEMAKEHSRKVEMFASQGKEEYQKIFLDELDHISKLISVFNYVRMYLTRVKIRLKTLTHVEEPLRHLPGIIQELEMIKPEIERIAPDLVTSVLEIERKVSSLITSTNLVNSPLPEIQSSSSTNTEIKKAKPLKKTLPPLPPEEEPIGSAQLVMAPKKTSMNVRASIDLIKTWLIDEIKSTGGVLDISSFCKKYGVTRSQVFMALQMLEREGKIKLSR